LRERTNFFVRLSVVSWIVAQFSAACYGFFSIMTAVFDPIASRDPAELIN
jgi:hypothetical protein